MELEGGPACLFSLPRAHPSTGDGVSPPDSCISIQPHAARLPTKLAPHLPPSGPFLPSYRAPSCLEGTKWVQEFPGPGLFMVFLI